MVQLLKLKERFFRFVGRFEIYVMAAVRFAVAYVAFYLINSTTGYMEVLDEYPVALILALLCSFLPTGLMMFFGAALILLQFYALSKELCLVTALIFVVLFCVYLRFTSRKGLYTMLTPLMSLIGVPYAMPVSCGLLSNPYTVISVVCGEIAYFILKHVHENSAMFSPANETSTTSILTTTVTTLLTDREMYLYLIAFTIAAIVVYCIRLLSFDHSHTVAVVFGIVIQMVLISAGEIAFGNTKLVLRVIIGCVVSLLISFVVNFLTHSLDYSRVEHVQFEDDEYYYYAKAVPKAFVPATQKQVKQINQKKAYTRKSQRGKHREVQEETLEERVMREFQSEDD